VTRVATPSLSVVIPATDRPACLAATVAAIERTNGPRDEVVVVTEPAGATPAFARNLGAARATGDVLVFVDADVVLHHDALPRIRRAFARDPELDGVVGAYDDAPAAAGAVSGFRNLLHHHVHTHAGGPIASFWSGLGAIRRDVFLAAGGFDAEHYGAPCIEDVELGMRLAAAGRRIVLEPALQGTHLKRWTLGGMVYTDLVLRGMPWVAVLLRTPDSPRVLNLGVRHQLSALASVAAVAAPATRRPAGAAVAAAALGALLALNADLYRLLLRRRGPREAVAGVGLHVVHHLVSVAALPLGALSFARKPGTFLDPGRHRARGLRGLHLDEARTPATPGARAWTTRPVVARASSA